MAKHPLSPTPYTRLQTQVGRTDYSKTCRKRSLKLVFKTDYRLMLVKRNAECSKGSILCDTFCH